MWIQIIMKCFLVEQQLIIVRPDGWHFSTSSKYNCERKKLNHEYATKKSRCLFRSFRCRQYRGICDAFLSFAFACGDRFICRFSRQSTLEDVILLFHCFLIFDFRCHIAFVRPVQYNRARMLARGSPGVHDAHSDISRDVPHAWISCRACGNVHNRIDSVGSEERNHGLCPLWRKC